MGPGVGGDLMALGVHALNDINVLLGQINLAFVDVVASDEESSLCVVGLHEIQDMGSESLLWAIIVRQGNGSSCDAAVDTRATVRDGANLGAGNG
jgi:hypothetical protein